MAKVLSDQDRVAEVQQLAAQVQLLVKGCQAVANLVSTRRGNGDSEELIETVAQAELTALSSLRTAIVTELTALSFVFQWVIEARRPSGREGLVVVVDAGAGLGTIAAVNDIPGGYAPDDFTAYVAVDDIFELVDTADNDGVYKVSAVVAAMVTATGTIEGTGTVGADQDSYLRLIDR